MDKNIFAKCVLKNKTISVDNEEYNFVILFLKI